MDSKDLAPSAKAISDAGLKQANLFMGAWQ